MSLTKALIVYRKELRDMLRDKRTIRSMIIIPVVAFPLLMMVAGYFASKSENEAHREASAVMIQGSQYAPKLMAALGKVPKIDVQPYQSDARQEVSDKKIRAVAVIPEGFDSDAAAGKRPKSALGISREMRSQNWRATGCKHFSPVIAMPWRVLRSRPEASL
jgi:sodium transport system permease protein